MLALLGLRFRPAPLASRPAPALHQHHTRQMTFGERVLEHRLLTALLECAQDGCAVDVRGVGCEAPAVDRIRNDLNNTAVTCAGRQRGGGCGVAPLGGGLPGRVRAPAAGGPGVRSRLGAPPPLDRPRLWVRRRGDAVLRGLLKHPEHVRCVMRGRRTSDLPCAPHCGADSIPLCIWRRYQQRGRAAEEAANTFYYLTYEGTVDLGDIDDPLQRQVGKALWDAKSER